MQSKRQSGKMLTALNVGHILVGVCSVIAAVLQFTPIGLDNAAFIDFRLLNVAHAVTGAVGLHMVKKSFGSVVAKSLYCLSLALALWTLAFYAVTLGQEVDQYTSISDIRRMDGGEELITDDLLRNHGGKLAVCAAMIVLAVVESILSAVSLVILNRLASDTYSNFRTSYPLSDSRRRQMAFVALMKIFFSVAAVTLGAYLESLYRRRSGFIKIGWQELTGGIVFAGACVDLHALYGSRHNLLNLKISLLLSIFSAVLSLKTLDYTMSNYFVLDVREYSQFDELKSQLQDALDGMHLNTDSDKKEAFMKFVVHAAVVGSLLLMFAHSVISAVEASSYIEWGGKLQQCRSNLGVGTGGSAISVLDGHNKSLGAGSGLLPRYGARYEEELSDDDVFEYDEALHRQKSCAGILQCVWGLALVALCVMSLVSWDFSRGYDGGAGVLWLGCLFIASGLVNANRPKTFTTSVYVLSVVSLVLAFERAIYSFNVIYQSINNPRFQSELQQMPENPGKQRGNYDAHTGRITLYAVESGLLLMEFFTATWTAVKLTQAIRTMPRPMFKSGLSLKGPLCSLGFFHLLYAFITISVSIAAEVALWGFNVHVSYLVFLTNGVVVLAGVFVQWMAAQQPQFLLSSAVLNAVTASVAFFVLAPGVRDLYTLVANYRSLYETSGQQNGGGTAGGFREALDAERRAKPVQEWIIGLNVLVLLLAVVEYVVSVISGMICSYLLHHAYDPHTSDLRFSTLRSQAPSGGQLAQYWASGHTMQPPSVLTLVNNGVDPATRTLTADLGRKSMTGGQSTIGAGAPERYFGLANDFRYYGRHPGVGAAGYPNNTTMPVGLRRSSVSNGLSSQYNGSSAGCYGSQLPRASVTGQRPFSKGYMATYS